MKFYSSVRIEVRRSAQIKKGEDIVGNRVKVKIVKNKVAPPFKTTEFDIMYNEGISASGDLLDTGVKYEVIEKKGNSYVFNEIKLGVGREVAKASLKADPKLMQEIMKAIYKKVREAEEAELRLTRTNFAEFQTELKTFYKKSATPGPNRAGLFARSVAEKTQS